MSLWVKIHTRPASTGAQSQEVAIWYFNITSFPAPGQIPTSYLVANFLRLVFTAAAIRTFCQALHKKSSLNPSMSIPSETFSNRGFSTVSARLITVKSPKDNIVVGPFHVILRIIITRSKWSLVQYFLRSSVHWLFDRYSNECRKALASQISRLGTARFKNIPWRTLLMIR